MFPMALSVRNVGYFILYSVFNAYYPIVLLLQFVAEASAKAARPLSVNILFVAKNLFDKELTDAVSIVIPALVPLLDHLPREWTNVLLIFSSFRCKVLHFAMMTPSQFLGDEKGR